MQFADVACALKTQTAMKVALQCARFLHTFQNLPSFCTTKQKRTPILIESTCVCSIGVARLELAASCSQSRRATNCATPRHPAAPPEYSISFFARFVNTESAADGTARSAFFQPPATAAGSSGKGRGSRRFLWEPGAGLVQLPKSRCKNYTECKTCCTLVASWPERCYHNTISP